MADYRKFVDGPTLIFQDRFGQIEWGEKSTQVITGVGATFNRGDGLSPETFYPIAEVVSITGPAMERDVIDVTSLNSIGGYREFIGGFSDSGEVSIVFNFTVDAYDDVDDDFEYDRSKNYEIHFDDDAETRFSFSAVVINLSSTVNMQDAVRADATFKIDGRVIVN